MFKKYKLWEIANFSQWKQVEIWDQFPEQKAWYKRFLRIVDFTNENEPIRYVENYWDRYYASKDDLVMIRYWSQTAWKVVIWKEWIIANNMFKINLDNNIVLNKYMYYYLSSEMVYNFLRSSQNSSTMPAINFWLLNSLEVEIPPLEYQQRAVACLDKLNNKIELNNQINHNLYDIWDKLYNEYYKDLKPWYKIVSLKEVSNNFDSKRKPMSSREREKHKWIYPYYWATSIIDYVDDYIFDWIYLLIWEDWTVMTDEWTPVLQYIWWKNRINNHAHVLQWSNISTEHLFFALRTINIKSLITWAVQLKLNQENMNKISFILWTDEINSKFEEKISVIMKKIKNNLVENEKLANIRDTLLPKLMNWEINLDNVTI